jgi:hypothetical protein
LTWLLRVDSFRLHEEESLVSGLHEARRNGHRYMLEELIAEGKTIVEAVCQNGLLNLPGGFSEADVSATLGSLEAAYYCEYGPKNSPEVNRLIEGLFDVSPAGN